MLYFYPLLPLMAAHLPMTTGTEQNGPVYLDRLICYGCSMEAASLHGPVMCNKRSYSAVALLIANFKAIKPFLPLPSCIQCNNSKFFMTDNPTKEESTLVDGDKTRWSNSQLIPIDVERKVRGNLEDRGPLWVRCSWKLLPRPILR